MKTPRLLCMLFLGVILTTIFSISVQAQKGKPQPPQQCNGNAAFAYSRAGQNQFDLMVMDADGSHQCVVVSKKFTWNVNPDWSPDGTQLIFPMESRNQSTFSYAYYKVNVNGTGLTKIRDFTRGGDRPAWSPVPLGEGEHKAYKIAFSSRLMKDGTIALNPEVFLINTINTDGENGLTQLTFPDGLRKGSVDWSPTGDRLAVDTYDGTFDDLWIYQVACTENSSCFATSEGNVVNVEGSLLNGSSRFGFDWAKTQDKLVVSANTGLGGTYDLWIIDLADPTQPVQLTDTPALNEYNPTWSPDDSQIAFMSNPPGGPLSLRKLRSDVSNDTTGGTPIEPLPAGILSAWGVNWRRNP